LVLAPDNRFSAHIWQKEDYESRVEYWEVIDDQWKDKQWTYMFQVWTGEVIVESYTLIDLEDTRDLTAAENHFWDGQKNVLEGDFQSAIEAFTQAIELEPEAAHYYKRRGEIECFLANEVACFDDYKAAFLLDSSDYWILYDLSNYYYGKGEFGLAYDYADRMIRLEPDLPLGYEARANVEIDFNQDYEDAVIDLSKAIELSPADAGYYYRRCFAYFELENYSLAIDDCTQCIFLNEEYDICYYDRARAYMLNGDGSSALNDFNKFLELVSPDNCPECQETARDYIDQNTP
jgi:tetratricopeptide (TPR) repeat protein